MNGWNNQDGCQMDRLIDRYIDRQIDTYIYTYIIIHIHTSNAYSLAAHYIYATQLYIICMKVYVHTYMKMCLHLYYELMIIIRC